jgi:hypothetical protein
MFKGFFIIETEEFRVTDFSTVALKTSLKAYKNHFLNGYFELMTLKHQNANI